MISWFTNVAAPYRVPIWDHIERQHALRVHLLETSESLRREGRRPDDWGAAAGDRYEWLPNLTVRRGERSFYIGRRPLIIPKSTSAVLIGGWESPLYWQVLLEAKGRGLRTVGFYESTLSSNRHSSGPVSAARSRFFRSLDAVVVPGAAAAAALESYGVVPDRIHEGFNAVDVSRFAAAASASPASRGPGHRYVFVGQLIPRKNPDALLRAFALMCSPEDSLTYIGGGAEFAQLRSETTRLGLDRQVMFLDPMTNHDLAEHLHTFDTLVLPSEEEVWGLVVNEALAAGLRVVVSERAGVAASVSGMSGVVVTTTSIKDVAAAMSTARTLGTTPIQSPEILRYTPELFADVFLKALLDRGANDDPVR